MMAVTNMTTPICHTPADMTQWTGRAEPFETARARYWYQLAQPYEAQHIGLIGF
ncbi:MAG TPA: formimidoylglutamase, partial [Psychrobacter sp.]|nr:formimidoylglutamase [Psychrobacter sp.]